MSRKFGFFFVVFALSQAALAAGDDAPFSWEKLKIAAAVQMLSQQDFLLREKVPAIENSQDPELGEKVYLRLPKGTKFRVVRNEPGKIEDKMGPQVPYQFILLIYRNADCPKQARKGLLGEDVYFQIAANASPTPANKDECILILNVPKSRVAEASWFNKVKFALPDPGFSLPPPAQSAE